MNYLKEAMEFYRDSYPEEELQPVGCSIEEVSALEGRLGFRLPGAHREFLLWMGRDVAGILSDSDWYIRSIEADTAQLPELLKSSGLPEPDKPYLRFLDHLGYVAAWYYVPPESEDPDITLYVQGDPEHPEPYVWGKFSAWVTHCIRSNSLNTWLYREWKQKQAARGAL